MKQIVSMVLAAFLAAVCIIPASAANGRANAVYTDLPGEDHWSYEGINYVISEGLMVGNGNGAFSPKAATSRAMLAAVLYRVAGSPEVDTSSNFTDVSQSAWYKKAVDWAYQTEVASGYSDSAFGPNDSLTREQAVTMLYNFVQVNGYSQTELSLFYNQDGAYETYVDSNQISKWAVPAMNWGLNAGLIHGTQKGGTLYLDPKGLVTREQLAMILYRFDHIVKWPGKGNAMGTENSRLDVNGVLISPSYVIDETDAELLHELLTDDSWEDTEDFLEYPSAFTIHLGDAEYMLYVKDGEWLKQCGFIITQENGDKVSGSMTTSDSSLLQKVIGICQGYTPE